MKVVILGAGKAGQFLYDQIYDKTATNIEVVGFGDNFATGEYRGSRIDKPAEILDRHGNEIDAVFIAAGAQKTVKILMDTALSYHIFNIYMLHDIAGKCRLSPFDDNGNIIPERLRKIGFSNEKPTLPYFEVPITDRCNLNCKGCLFGCNAFSEGGDIKLSQIEKDARRMTELFFDIPWIRILGGEPLLHPQIIDILKLYRQVFPKSEIDLCTNGLLIPKMSSEFFTVLREEHISVHISGYKPTYHLLNQLDQIMKSYGLNYIILKRESFSKYYTLESDKDMNNSYWKCGAAGCRELYGGRLLRCSAVLAFEKFNSYFNTGYKLSENEDWFDIHKENVNAWELKDRIDKASNVCQYCDPENSVDFSWDYSGVSPHISDYVL